MKKKEIKKTGLIIILVVMVMGLTACSGKKETADRSLDDTETSEVSAEVSLEAEVESESFVDIQTPESTEEDEGPTEVWQPSTDNPYRRSIQMNYDEIKAEEEEIRRLVNGGECTQVNIESSPDGDSWDRNFWFHGSELIFAFYQDTSGTFPDHRYYFKDGCMIEWIPYTGNGAPEDIRNFASDLPLDEDWYDLQERILKEADVDIDFYGNAAEEFVITNLVDKLYSYERMVLTDITWDAGKYKAQVIDFTTDNRELAVAALFSVNIEKTGVTKETLDNGNIERYLIPGYMLANAEEEIFGKMVSVDDLPDYDDDFISSSACIYKGTPTIIFSLYEDDTAYVRNDEYMTKEADGSYIVIHEAYCGYWGNNTGLSNFQVEYKLENDGEKYSITRMNIRKIKNTDVDAYSKE